MPNPHYVWERPSPLKIGRRNYICGFCGNNVGPDQAFHAKVSGSNTGANIYICPACSRPTFFGVDGCRVPAVRFGREIQGINDEGVKSLYNEARDCTSVRAYTAAVLLCRKILMNISVQQGAKEGQSFVSYIDYLEAEGYVPPNGREWVDIIRKKGNEATHEIALMDEDDARQILHFVEMLLRFIYEFPSLIEK